MRRENKVEPDAEASARTDFAYARLSDIKPWDRNPRGEHHDLGAIHESVRRFGFRDPIGVNPDTLQICEGHGRREVLLQLKAGGAAPPDGIHVDADGEWLVPVVYVPLDGQEAEAYAIAHNRTTELAGWDDQLLADVLIDLKNGSGLDGVGYDGDDLDDILRELGKQPGFSKGEGGADRIDQADELQKKWQVKPGDLWLIHRAANDGKSHRLLCGDSTLQDSYERLLQGAKANICWTDPPWRQRSIANDNLGEKFDDFAMTFCQMISDNTEPGAALYMAMSAQEWPTIDLALRTAEFHWSSTIIWAKDQLVLSRKDYHTQYEPLWYGWNALNGAPRLVPLEDRKQSDLWQIDRPHNSELHPTTKPVELVARALRNSSHIDDIVLDLFLGSGTTAVACEQIGRVCAGIELEARYCAVILQRMTDAGCACELESV